MFFTAKPDQFVISIPLDHPSAGWGEPSYSFTAGTGAPSGDLGFDYYFDTDVPENDPYQMYKWDGLSAWDGPLEYTYDPTMPTVYDVDGPDYWVSGTNGNAGNGIFGPRTPIVTPEDDSIIVYDEPNGIWVPIGIADAINVIVNNWIQAAIDNLVDAAPATLDTLNELAAALNDDASFATTVANSLAGKAALASSNSFTVGNQVITAASAGQLPLKLVGAAGQTANLLELRTSTNTSRLSVSDAGYVTTEDVQADSGVRVGSSVTYTAGQRWVSVQNAASTPSSATTGAIVYADNGHLFARSVNANVGLTRQVINAQTGTTYTLDAGDSGALVTVSNAAAAVVTVPAESTTNYAVGTRIDLARLGAGTVTVAGDVGVTVRSADSKLGLRVQYSSASLVKTGADTWLLVGDLV